ncbi:hypothetical protein PoB_005457100, partial [Plakobranchus ocellatus]
RGDSPDDRPRQVPGRLLHAVKFLVPQTGGDSWISPSTREKIRVFDRFSIKYKNIQEYITRATLSLSVVIDNTPPPETRHRRCVLPPAWGVPDYHNWCFTTPAPCPVRAWPKRRPTLEATRLVMANLKD